jgi:hypothetical protein
MEMEIKTIVMYHFTLVMMAIIKKTKTNADEMQRKGIPTCWWWEYKLL